MNFRSKNTRIFLILIIVVLAFVFYPLSAKASWMDDALSTVVSQGIKIIAYILNFIGSMLLALASYLAGFTIGLNDQILDKSNALVEVGWKIVRDITNLGFVLVIVIVAIATILRMQQYGAQKLLVKLIGAAIIVNFSLTIAGVFIDFSQVITKFFFDKVGANPILITERIAGAFNPQRFYLGDEDPLPPDPSEEVSGLTAFTTAILTSIAGLIFTIIFTLIAAFVVLTFALMMLYRYVMLSFLLVLAPIVWLFWVFPALSGQFNIWWKKFLQWVFFAPAASFFIYLSIAAAEELGKTKITLTVSGSSLLGMGSILQNVITQGAQMVIIAGIMIGGLIMAQKMGITGAKGAMEIAKKVGVGAKKGVGTWARQQTTRAGARIITGRVGEKMQSFGANRGKFLRTLTTPVRTVGKGVYTAGQKMAGTKLGQKITGSKLGKRAQATLLQSKPTLLGSIFKGISGQFGIRQWQCNICSNAAGPGKKPPLKCPNLTCPTNISGDPQYQKTSWKPL